MEELTIFLSHCPAASSHTAALNIFFPEMLFSRALAWIHPKQMLCHFIRFFESYSADGQTDRQSQSFFILFSMFWRVGKEKNCFAALYILPKRWKLSLNVSGLHPVPHDRSSV